MVGFASLPTYGVWWTSFAKHMHPGVTLPKTLQGMGTVSKPTIWYQFTGRRCWLEEVRGSSLAPHWKTCILWEETQHCASVRTSKQCFFMFLLCRLGPATSTRSLTCRFEAVNRSHSRSVSLFKQQKPSNKLVGVTPIHWTKGFGLLPTDSAPTIS